MSERVYIVSIVVFAAVLVLPELLDAWRASR